MANTLDTLKAASVKPLYEEIKFSEFHPNMTGVLRVRVNPSRKMARELQQAQANNDNAAYVRLTAQLIPRDSDTDTPLSFEEFSAFIEGADDDDAAFSSWLMRTIWERVSAHFLAATRSHT